MPPAAWFAVSVKSRTCWSFTHAWMCGASPSMRARMRFHASRFHAFTHGSFGSGISSSICDAGESFAIHRADRAGRQVVHRDLIRVARFVRAQEEPAVAAPVGLHFHVDL